MTQIDRRRLLALSAAALALPPAIARAQAIDAKVKTGTIKDVEHVVILMQENRSFDHYFGTMNGVRGFADRFPIPLPDKRTVWTQASPKSGPPLIAPFPLNTAQTFAHMRVEGTPHNWADAQYAWDEGRMAKWPEQKLAHSMGYYVEADIPFQFALANAFTLCEAYHCSFQGGTNTNRLFLWTGTNDPGGKLGGPSISNSHDTLPEKGGAKEPYLWATYPERLEAAGVSWKIYEDMADNFGDNPLVGFQSFRDSLAKAAGSNPALAAKGLSTQHLDVLRADVQGNRLPQVSWICSPAKDSEHPGPSSPAQGADYTARVLDCLTSNPDVWAKTALLVMFDENDGFFDHVPPPAPPSRDASGKMLGGSTVDVSGEYHLMRHPTEAKSEREDLNGRPYGLGPRAPLYVISPWSRGGWTNAEVSDHTSVIRFLEARFGVMEPNISPWRRAVCGDLTSCFDFKTPNAAIARMPETLATAERAAALPGRTKPPTPDQPIAPTQASGVRRSRALPYGFDVSANASGPAVRLSLRNTGSAGAVLHVYDRLRLGDAPRRYTLEYGKSLEDEWPAGPYDLFVLGPNGFHRHFAGVGGEAISVSAVAVGRKIQLKLKNNEKTAQTFAVSANAYTGTLKPWTSKLATNGSANHLWDLSGTSGWYDLTISSKESPGWSQRFAGRLENGQPSMSDPAMGGPALMSQA
ncbi:MAG: phospholipase C, phosphocholine-specific [Hyphomonadaceae bacterium]|nr:phospholipase C, phosphocholine-specific [Hyphomonadaceae bacterium]